MYLICLITCMNFVLQKLTDNKEKDNYSDQTDPSALNSEEDNAPPAADRSQVADTTVAHTGDHESVNSADSTLRISRRKLGLSPEVLNKKAKVTPPDEDASIHANLTDKESSSHLNTLRSSLGSNSGILNPSIAPESEKLLLSIFLLLLQLAPPVDFLLFLKRLQASPVTRQSIN